MRPLACRVAPAMSWNRCLLIAFVLHSVQYQVDNTIPCIMYAGEQQMVYAGEQQMERDKPLSSTISIDGSFIVV